jgi:hypothetical protein
MLLSFAFVSAVPDLSLSLIPIDLSNVSSYKSGWQMVDFCSLPPSIFYFLHILIIIIINFLKNIYIFKYLSYYEIHAQSCS